MKCNLTLVLAVILAACSGTMPQTDKYRLAANSWEGEAIQDMVTAWGTPNIGYVPPKEGNLGVAGWAAHRRTPNDDYRCKTMAYFDESGAITEVDVEYSRSCQRPYKDKLEQMTRKVE